MTVKLFQDVAGTIPAVLAGQPVGFIKRTKGSDDAKQATALSKPTLARWPKSGVRNFASLAQDLNAAAWLQGVVTNNGLTYTRLGSGVGDDGVPYIDVSIVGVLNQSPSRTIYFTSAATTAALLGEIFTGRFEAALLRGAWGLAGIRCDLIETENNVGLSGFAMSGSAIRPAADFERTTVTKEVLSPQANGIRIQIAITAPIGTVLDLDVRIKGLMNERGAVQTPLQFNYSPNDIVEPNVADVWHLYNDGGDSLNVTLPAGTYGLATIGIDRQIVIGTFVSDGTTPVNILRHERQLDVSYRLGAYSAAEELAIRDAWGRKYA